MSLLSVENLTVTALMGRGRQARLAPVLRAISLTLGKGQVLGVVGESGAGKSMLGRAIAGYLPAGFSVASGRVDFNRRNILALTPDTRRAMRRRKAGIFSAMSSDGVRMPTSASQ